MCSYNEQSWHSPLLLRTTMRGSHVSVLHTLWTPHHVVLRTPGVSWNPLQINVFCFSSSSLCLIVDTVYRPKCCPVATLIHSATRLARLADREAFASEVRFQQK